MACEAQKSKPTRHLTTPDRCILHTWRCRELSRVIPPTSVKRSAARVRPFPPRQPRWSPHGQAPAYAQPLAAESLRPCVSDGGRRLRGDLPRSASARSRTSGQRSEARRHTRLCGLFMAARTRTSCRNGSCGRGRVKAGGRDSGLGTRRVCMRTNGHSLCARTHPWQRCGQRRRVGWGCGRSAAAGGSGLV